jgi:hypothetical protein
MIKNIPKFSNKFLPIKKSNDDSIAKNYEMENMQNEELLKQSQIEVDKVE